MKPVKQKNKYTSPFNFLSKSKLKKEINEDWKSKYIQENNYTQLLVSYNSVNQALTDFEPVDRNEWLASNVISLYKQMEQVVAVLNECCSCSQMSGGRNFIYMWIDEKGKRIKVSANEFMNLYMTTADKILSQQEIMPTQNGVDFPQNFNQIMQKIFRWMFQIISHAYNCHFGSMISFQFVACLNTIFLHLYIIVQEFQLFDSKEFEPLEELINKWKNFNLCDS